MTISEWNQYLTDKITKDTEKKLAEALKEARKQVNEKISFYFSEYGRGKTIPAGEYFAYQRNVKLESYIDEIEKNLKADKLKIIQNNQVDLYNQVFNTILYDANNNGLAFNFAKINKEAVLLSIQNPIDKLKLPMILEFERQEITRQLQISISSGIISGRGYRDVADTVSNLFDGDYNKALRVVRTESGKVKTTAELNAMAKIQKDTKQTVYKTWIATKDSRTRDTHKMMDGVRIPLDDNFVLPGAIGQGPRNLQGDPGEIINCRCSLVYDYGQDNTNFNEADFKRWAGK